ncbi:MAG: alpha/beta fold hydrolase [Bacteroidota bacterium]
MRMFFFVALLPFLSGCGLSQNSESKCPFNVNISNTVCSVLEVPAKHSELNGSKIALSYLILRTNNPLKKDPIVFLQGGPGAGAIVTMADVLAGSSLRNERDIVLVDQRGTGFSEAHCKDLGLKFLNMMAQNLTPEEEYAYMLEISKECKSELKDKAIDPRVYNTRENAADIEALRTHLGYEQWIIMGGSYGSRLGLEYMRTYSKSVSASILFGLYPQHINLYDNILGNLSTSLHRVFEACANDDKCNRKYPEIKDRFYNVKDKLISEPLSFEFKNNTFHLNAQDMILLVHQMLYHPILIERIPEFINAVEKRDPKPIKAAVEVTAGTMELINGVMYWSIMSHEELPFVGMVAMQEDLKNNPHLSPGPAFFISDIQVQETWLNTKADDSFKEPVSSDLPTLLINGRFDPVTPVSNAESTLRYLSNGQLVEFSKNSHSLMNNCFFELVESFLEDPSAKLDDSCAQVSEGFRWR